ncbi:MAG: DMT family transporter [Desulfurococcales archaeon]|nr:DMT family transporter [Desulfurococcales archaeon]
MPERWVAYSLAALLMWGLWGVVLKAAEARLGEWYKVYVASNAAVILGVAVVALTYREDLSMPLGGALTALAAGALGTLGYAMLVLALKSGGPSSAVITITALYPAVTAMLARLLLRETLRAPQMLGIMLAVVAVALISYRPD